MIEKDIINKLLSNIEKVPSEVEIFQTKQYSKDNLEQRAKSFIERISKTFKIPMGRSNWETHDAQTIIRLPLGMNAVLFHASGSMKLVTNLNPMESLFKSIEKQEKLVAIVKNTTERLNINQLVEKNQSLKFERLWKIKAAATNRDGKSIDSVLCRIVGAYRHFVREIPVLGPASLAIKLADEGSLDSILMQIREPSGAALEKVKVIQPEQAVNQVILQLKSLFTRSKVFSSDNEIKPEWLRFGYLNFSKRKVQRLLAPVYICSISIEGKMESQAYQFIVPASKEVYLPLSIYGCEAPSFATLKRK